jgi:peptidoglycan/LPS O-acetylase OafA/YrhL
MEQGGSVPAAARVLEYRTVTFIPMRWPTFPALIAAMLVALSRSRLFGPWADCRVLSVTAGLSFGIYLWHIPMMALVRLYWPELGSDSLASQLAFAVAVVVMSYLAAAVSYVLIERPVLRLAHRKRATSE